jgi:hypothetical protein
MALFLFNRIHRAIQNRRNDHSEDSVLSSQTQINDNHNLGKQSDAPVKAESSPTSTWKYKIVLLGSLGIPVFLETLDYTGKFETRIYE